MGIDPSAFIHPSSHVEDCEIGARSKVWQFSSIIRKSRLGEDCNVGSCATIDSAWLGNNCIVGPGAFVVPGTHIDDGVFIGPNVTICNDRWPACNKSGFDIKSLFSDFVSVHIKSGASIGANAVVLPGVSIGHLAMIAAGATVERDIPDNNLLTRSGEIIPIKDDWRQRRMRSAS